MFQSGFSHLSLVDENVAMYVYWSGNNQIQGTLDHHNIGNQKKFQLCYLSASRATYNGVIQLVFHETDNPEFQPAEDNSS